MVTDMHTHTPANDASQGNAKRPGLPAFLAAQGFGPYQWLIFTLCFLIVLLDGFDTAAIGFIAPSLVQEWGIARPMLAPVLSAALFGLAVGALTSGPLADRFGRKIVLLLSVLLFGAACLASSQAADLSSLTLWRFITGIGLGAAMPNAVTVMSEYSPDRIRSTITNLMFCGFPLGAAFGGFLAAWMIPNFGWRSVLLAGGIAPLLLALLILLLLPESIRHLAARPGNEGRIRAILRRLAPRGTAVDHVDVTPAPTVPGNKAGIGLVLSRSYLVGSVALWVAYFMGLVIFYALINWMPILFKDAGLAPKTATLVASLFPLGGIGTVLFGLLMDKVEPNRVIAAGFALTSIAVFAIGQAVGDVGWLVFVVFAAGALMNTSQSSLPALAASYYPTEGRATGVAWMMGVGRFGGIAGSFLVAELSRRQLSFSEVFTVVAIPALIAAVALVVKLMQPVPAR